MFPIVAKEQLSAEVYSMWIHAPLIAEERKAGQFIILQIDEQFGERIPLTIADADPAKGDVRIIFQAVGYSTKRLARMEVGEALPVFLGPLGRPTHIEMTISGKTYMPDDPELESKCRAIKTDGDFTFDGGTIIVHNEGTGERDVDVDGVYTYVSGQYHFTLKN